MLTGRAKPILITGDADKQRLAKWSSIVQETSASEFVHDRHRVLSS